MKLYLKERFDMFPILLNDNTYIYSDSGLEDYLTSFGFNIEDLKHYFAQEYIDKYEDIAEQKAQLELEVDDWYIRIHQFADDVANTADRMVNNLRVTKQQHAKALRDLVIYYTS